MFAIDLILNLSFLVALSIISGFIDNRWSSKTIKGTAMQGFLFGIVAMLGMLSPLVFDDGIVFDGRSVVISLCAFFFGPIAAIISAVMAIILRVYQGGAGAIMGVSVITASAIIGTIFYYRRKKRNRRVSGMFLWQFGFIVHIAMVLLTFTLPYQSAIAVLKNIGFAFILFYPLATILIGKILHDQEVKLESVQALRKSENLFRSLAQSSPVGMFRISKEKIILFVNEKWCEIFGVKRDEVQSKNFQDFIFEHDIKTVNEQWQSLSAQDKTFSLEFRAIVSGNRNRWVLGQFEPETNEFGDIVGFVGTIFDIDERKLYEENLKKWETIFNSTRMGIALGIGESAILDIFNPAFAKLYGYSEDELKISPISIIYAPEERERIPLEIKNAYERGYNVFESWHIRKDGTRFPALVSVTGVKDNQGNPLYRIINVQDISERLEAELRLKAERSRLANIIEGTNVGTWEWNVQTGATIYNARWANMIGYDFEEVMPATVDTWLRFVHPDDKDLAMERINKHFEGETEFYETEFRMQHKNGQWIWVQDRGKVIQWTEDGKPFMMYGTHIDITERKLWEDRLKQSEIRLKEQNEEYLALNEELTEANSRLLESQKRLKEQNEEYLALNEELVESNHTITTINNELVKARAKAEESDRLKSAFLANMSHEIRTPMNAIIGFSEILLRPNIPKEKQQLYTEVLNASCNQLLGIINDVLDISKIETGQVTLSISEVDINRVVRGVLSLFSNNAANKKNNLRFSSGLPDQECLVITDEAKLNQIISNLVSNAIKFTENGQVEVGYKVQDKEIEFFVSDTGIGISHANQKLIFDRFRQVEEAPTRNYGGTGLGLSICKAFVELMGGKISVNSSLGNGSRFTFSIPYKPVKINAEIPMLKTEFSYNFKNYTVLVAEDEPANFFYLKELLAETEVEIIHVDDGKKAIDTIKNNKTIDLVLMDVKMPIMNGIDATKTIRGLGVKTPVIALTAYAMSGDKTSCLEAGCDGYIPKPIIRDDLLSMMDLFLKKKK